MNDNPLFYRELCGRGGLWSGVLARLDLCALSRAQAALPRAAHTEPV
ncbi:hypothetical protein KTD18_17340 [Burkholderia multivorans]|nr:hypothetical protein [Burkholderia multivorans]MBU9293314.1 hypothetical protein [Burkholderia multivorans]